MGRTAIAIAALVALAAGARGEAPTAGRTSELPRGRYPGIESGLARGSRFARAIDAARGERYREAEELFKAAAEELRLALVEGRALPPSGRSLKRKADQLADACQQVREVRRDETRSTGPGDRAMKEAFALHNLFLSARALSGHDEPLLYQRAARAYRASVSATQTPAFAPLGFAALLAAGGDRTAARMELERLPTWRIAQEPSDLAPTLYELVAAARAALGERERALEALGAARDLAPDWALRRRSMLAGNDFDALRSDPRFVALVGEAE